MKDEELRKELWKMIGSQLRDTSLLDRQDYFQKVSENPYGTTESMDDSTLQPKSLSDRMSYSPIFKDSSYQCMEEDCFDKPFRLFHIWREAW